jgi:hypothetical protein
MATRRLGNNFSFQKGGIQMTKNLPLPNFRHNLTTENMLSAKEANLLTELVLDVLEHLGEDAQYGTFILDGQREGESAQCLLRFNLPKGIARFGNPHISHSSDELAEESINIILNEVKGSIPNAIYSGNQNMALVLKSSFGRYLCSFYEGGGEHETSAAILAAVAKALAKLRADDRVLKSSIAAIQFMESRNKKADEAIQFVNDTLDC